MRKLQESSIEKEKVITAYDLLERQFPGVMVLSPENVAMALGFSRKSIYGQIAAGLSLGNEQRRADTKELTKLSGQCCRNLAVAGKDIRQVTLCDDI